MTDTRPGTSKVQGDRKQQSARITGSCQRNRLGEAPSGHFLDKLSFPGGSAGKESTCNVWDRGSIPGSGRSPGEGNGYPLQYSCLENPMDRGALQATVHRVAELNPTEWQRSIKNSNDGCVAAWKVSGFTMEYYSAIKKNSFESVLTRWMKLEPIMQSEVSQKDKDHYSILTHIYGI